MGQSVQKEDMLSVPSGGIADFYMSDEDIAVIEQEEAQKAFGSEGVAAFDTVAKKMASYGRFGDDRIVHVESGEIVVPRALIEQSPELKDSIFSHLREQGVEDPERYVVGSSANSLNPETGLPEFFLGKIVKGVKKAFKGVGKVLKKVAPVILPIALSMTPLGAVYGAALGSGIGTLMQGGSIEDALKSAVIAGGTGAIFKGFQGKGSFGENIKAEFANPGARFSQLGQGMTGSESFFRPFDAPTVASAPPTGGAEAAQTTMSPLDSPKDLAVAPKTGPSVSAGSTNTDPSFFDQAKDFIMPENVSTTDALKQMGVDPAAATETQFKLAQEMAAEQSPGFLRRYGPSIALAGLGAGAAGFFDAPEEDEPKFLTGADLLEQDPDKYKLPDEEIQYVAPYDPFVPQRPVFTAADGGVVGGLNRLGEMSDQMVDQLNNVVYGGGQGMGGGVVSLMQTPPGSLPSALPNIESGVYKQPMNTPMEMSSGFPFANSITTSGFFDVERPGYLESMYGPANDSRQVGDMERYRLAQQDARRQREGGFMGRVMLPGEGSFEDFMNMQPGGQTQAQYDLQQTQLYEDGGDVFPRRTGGIMPDEGIAGEDSVRAMLMPGEFVMTTDAVKGLGNGNNDQGIRKMYDMMRGLEAKGRAMA